MIYRNFDQMIQAVKAKKYMKRCAVAAAENRCTLEATVSAYRQGIIEPILVGNKRAIQDILSEMGNSSSEFSIVDSDSPEESAKKAIEMIRSGEADCMMKGQIETWTLMRSILSESSGLRTGRLMSAFAMLEVPSYHKLLASTDGGITLYPNLVQKKMIIENAVAELKKFGVINPKVAVLAAAEIVSNRMPETVDAYELKKMNERGEIRDCIVEGPISYDLAISKKAAHTKRFESPVAGDADLLIWPNITAGNITAKVLVRSCGAKTGFYIAGAKVPIIMVSRASDSEERFLSIVFGVASLEE